MKKYEAVIILNPNLSSKVDSFIKDFEKLLKANTFNIKKMEDIGRRQLSYSINNHNKGHYLIFNIEGNAENIIDIENKVAKLIRLMFIALRMESALEYHVYRFDNFHRLPIFHLHIFQEG